MRIPGIVWILLVINMFPRDRVAERLGYPAMRCLMVATALIPILWLAYRAGR